MINQTMDSTDSATSRHGAKVLGVTIDALTWEQALGRLHAWAQERKSSYVCFTNAHSIITTRSDPAFAAALEGADLVTPDGAPVAWMLRKLGFSDQQRINGPDLMWAYCDKAAQCGESIYLYGSTQPTLDNLVLELLKAFPTLKIAGAVSPPFRQLSAEEDAEVVRNINMSGATTLWVGLGCPKQEIWMAAHRGRIAMPMLGVGAAFDYHAKTTARAPNWMRNSGLEWLHRLASEPKRLWRRYLVTNTLFVTGAIKQLAAGNNSSP